MRCWELVPQGRQVRQLVTRAPLTKQAAHKLLAAWQAAKAAALGPRHQVPTPTASRPFGGLRRRVDCTGEGHRRELRFGTALP